jgi:hypothetical protein
LGSISPDPAYPALFRVVLLGGGLSDLTNRARAQEYAVLLAMRQLHGKA